MQKPDDAAVTGDDVTMPMWGRMLGRSGRNQQYDKGIRLFDQGLYEQAIEAFEEALSESKSGPLTERLAKFYLAESYSALALSLISQTDWSKAIRNLESAVALSPNYADLHYHLGVAHFQSKDPQTAIPSFERALEINPGYAKARLYLGMSLYATGQRREGIASAETAIQLDSTLNKSYLDKAKQADSRGDTEIVLEALRRVGETPGDEALFHARVALDLFRRGMLEDAISEYQQALSIAPEYADLRNQLGVTLHAAERYAEAVEQFVYALNINPRYVEARLNHGVALQSLGRTEEARAEYEKVLGLDPENHAAKERLENL
jgi:tetratricopeptide (TPR) repeat protein